MNLAAEEGVWAPAIVINCPSDYYVNAANHVSLELADIYDE